MPEASPGGSRTRGLIGLATVAVVIVGVGALIWWIGNRPAHLIIAPTPADATVMVGAHEGSGLTELDVPAGPVVIVLRAPDHLPSELRIDVGAGSTVRLNPRLVPVTRP